MDGEHQQLTVVCAGVMAGSEEDWPRAHAYGGGPDAGERTGGLEILNWPTTASDRSSMWFDYLGNYHGYPCVRGVEPQDAWGCVYWKGDGSYAYMLVELRTRAATVVV